MLYLNVQYFRKSRFIDETYEMLYKVSLVIFFAFSSSVLISRIAVFRLRKRLMKTSGTSDINSSISILF